MSHSVVHRPLVLARDRRLIIEGIGLYYSHWLLLVTQHFVGWFLLEVRMLGRLVGFLGLFLL